MSYRIRAAHADEHVRLLSLWRRAVEASHDFLTPADVDWYQEIVAGYLPLMADLRVAVAVDAYADGDGSPLGFIAQDDGHIHMLFVDPRTHGRGVGTALLAEIATEFAVLHVEVNEQNPGARAFYAARGFLQVGRAEVDDQGRPFPLLRLRREIFR